MLREDLDHEVVISEVCPDPIKRDATWPVRSGETRNPGTMANGQTILLSLYGYHSRYFVH